MAEITFLSGVWLHCETGRQLFFSLSRKIPGEYDAAQEWGEVQPRGGNRWLDVGDDNTKPATAADLGLRRDEIHEARP
jgi:hypothetical protein